MACCANLIEVSVEQSNGSPTIVIVSLSLKLFPNPTMGRFNVNISDDKKHTVEILDASGKLIKKIDDYVQSSFSLDISNYAPGIYHLKISPEQIIFPIVKNR